MRISKEQLASSGSLNYLATFAYDQTKWNLGKGVINNNGASQADKYFSTHFDAIRPSEESVGYAVGFPYAQTFSPTVDYLWAIENTTASATRRISMWQINKQTMARTWNGYITITFPVATNVTVRDFKIDYIKNITGTVAVSGTAVTGTGTAFLTNRTSVGARIGFGSTDPTQISTWYRVSVVTSDGSITLATSAGTIGAGSTYVMEEFRPVILTTNATTTNGGVMLVKGITPEDYIPGGTAIAAAVSTDSVKACFWLKDASTQTNIVAAGAAIDYASSTYTSQTVYVIDLVSAGNYKWFTYNLRSALTVATGASTSAWILATGNNAFTGTGSQNANLCIATPSHGTYNGVKSLYFVSTTRLMGTAVTNITSGSTTVALNAAVEAPPGGATTLTATGALTTIEYITDLDSFYVGTTGTYQYLTKFVASGTEFDLAWAKQVNLLEQSTKGSGSPLQINNAGVAMTFNDNPGSNLAYITKLSTTAGINVMYILNVGGHWDYVTGSGGTYIISPEITLTNCNKFYRVYTLHQSFVGSQQLGKPAEPFETYYRTTNIGSDATSGWSSVDTLGDLSAVSGASSIQFKTEFKTLGESCIPARINGYIVDYEDTASDSHWALSDKSDPSTKAFVFWFKTAYGSTVPTLTIKLYDADTGGLLLTDTTATMASGTFTKSTDGTTFGSYNTTDKTNTTNYIKYIPTSIADNIKVEAYIS